MNRATWKASERRFAELLGGQRVPVTGRGRGETPDIAHPVFAIEHKCGQVMSSRLVEAVQQARAAAKQTGKLPLVTIEQSNGPGRANGRYVMMDIETFLALCPQHHLSQ